MRDLPSVRAYRALLKLFPAEFLAVHGESMEQMFSEMRSREQSEHGSLRFRFWAALLWDSSTGAAFAWGEVLRGPSARSGNRRQRQEPTFGDRMATLFADIRLALRQISRRPSYALMVILLMSLGIAGNVAVFRVFNGLFLKPLPFSQPEQLVDLNETAPAWNLEDLMISYRDFDTWRAENETFQAMAAIEEGGGSLLIDGSAQQVSYLRTTHGIDKVLRLAPELGRFYTSEEDHPDRSRVMMLSYSYWQEQFGGHGNVLGTTLSLDGDPVEIIGVLPREASFLDESDLWVPLQQQRSDWHGWGLNAVGRLKPDVSIDQALGDLLAIHKGMIEEFDVNEISSPTIESFRDRYLGDYRLGSGFLLGAVGAVLAIACANIAGLMFVRSLSRRQEISMRVALGASRGRIVNQLLTEGLVLALMGAGIGSVLGTLGSNALVLPLSEQFPGWVTFDIDVRVVLLVVGLTVAASLFFSLAPALEAARSARGLMATSRVHGSRRQRRGMNWLVSGEVALALALLVLGGLSVMDLRELGRVDPGFEPEGLTSYGVSLPSARYPDDQARLGFVEEYLPQLEAIPGVNSVAIASTMPLSGHWGTFFVVEAAPARAEEEANPVVLNRLVTPSYFETVGVELVAGRRFTEFDGREGNAMSIIVNQRFVETHLTHLDDPLGAQVTRGTEMSDDAERLTVVGVAKDVKHYGVDEEMRPGVYHPLRQSPLEFFQVALSINGDSAPLISQARAITSAMDLELPIYSVQAMTDELADSLWTRRATSWVIGAFSAVALLLAIAGLYGVISYGVGQRTQEISIRMALGAKRRDVLNQILRQGMVLVVIGIAIGLAASVALAAQMGQMLVSIKATNPLIYLLVTGVLLLVAAIANYLPARRAASIEPMRALRGE